MSPACRFCAEPLPAGPEASDARCTSCGERIRVLDRRPRPMPTPLVLTTILGVGYLALGGCCGASLVLNGVSMASMVVGQPGSGLPIEPFVAALAITGASCLLHAAAGLGLLLRQGPARPAAMVCAVIDLGLGVLLIAAGIAILNSRSTASVGEVFLLQAGLGSALALTSIAAIVLLRHPTTRAAFAAPSPRAR